MTEPRESGVNRIRLMVPALRSRTAVRAGLLAVALVLGTASLSLWRSWQRLPSVRAPGVPGPSIALDPAPVSFTGVVWTVFRSSSAPSDGGGGGAASQYRLAGTFFVFGGEEKPTRRAVLDRVADRTQHIVGEGEDVGPLHVTSILYDHIVVRFAGRDEEIWLKQSKGGAGGGAVDSNALAMAAGGEAQGTRFGHNVQGNRWEMSRERLIAYYQELMDEPDRLVKVFDSFKPIYDRERKITGYIIGVEGEADFFPAVGLQEGDVVRKVNSMDMTNRRRAEYFVSEFVKDQVNVFVLDIERNGQPQQLVYEVR